MKVVILLQTILILIILSPFIDCGECSDVRNSLNYQRAPCLPCLLADFLNHGGPVFRGEVLQVS